MSEKQLNPDFKQIMPICIRELDIKYSESSYIRLYMYKKYWLERITNKLDEYKKSMTPKSEKRKMLNIINMAAMAWSVTK